MLELHLHAPRGAQQLAIDLRLTSPWTVLFGASGTGKSSILRAICGLWRPNNCTVVLHGKEVTMQPPHLRHIALVTHHASLLPHKTVMENVLFAMQEKNVDEQQLQRLYIHPLRDRKPATLSGGEQQCVALARAIASRPRVLLLDEALSGLDLHLRSQLIAELKRWQQQTGALILSVTHNLSETLECADEVALLEAGHILRTGPARDVLKDRRDHLLRLLGQ